MTSFAGARALQLVELQRAFRALDRWRDRLLFGVLLLTGCRIAEAVALNVGDLYREDGTVRDVVRFTRSRTKGRRSGRDVPVGPDLRELAIRWWRELDDRRPPAPLFPSRTTKPDGDRRITVRSAARALETAFRRAGLERASSHSLRKSAAILLSRQGVEVRVIQSVLGHSSLAATDVYLQQVAEWEKRAAVERLHVPLVALVPPEYDRVL